MNAQTKSQQRHAREAVRDAYRGGKNFLTPYPVEYGMIAQDLAYEISQGEGMDRGTLLVGVSVVRFTDGAWKPDYDLGSSFASPSIDLIDTRQPDTLAYRDALAYIAELRS